MTGPVLMCPYCGADSPRKCDLGEDGDDTFEDGDGCPWQESGQYEADREMAEDDEEDEDDDEDAC